MANFTATSGPDAIVGTSSADNIIVNHAADIQPGDTFDGADGIDILWVTKGMMDIDMPGNIDFTGAVFQNTEVLAFNYMKMLMPGTATFTSDQFGSGLLSNALEVRGAWGNQDITVDLIAGDSTFDAAGWTFPTLGGTTTGTTNGLPSGTATSVWGAYWNLNTTGMNQNESVGGTDTIHINGSSGANTIAGTMQDDMIDGSGGSDTLLLSGSWADYTITSDGQPAPTYTIADRRTSSSTGTDKVTNIEIFQFSDATVAQAGLLDMAPRVVIDSGPLDALNTNRTSATFDWTGTDGTAGAVDHYEYSTDGGANWTSTSSTSVTLTGLMDGLQAFRVRAVDASGHSGPAASRDWTVATDVPYMATASTDDLMGTAADDDFIVNKQAFVNMGDRLDGGDGTDTLWAAQGMMDYEEDFDFSAASIHNMEALAFNYMPMPMPGQAIFSSSQFGAGLLSEDMMVYGAWGLQDITVNLAAGDSSFDASGWQFANAGATSGSQSAVWGRYTYTGPGMMNGEEVGGHDTIHLNGSAGNNTITGTSMLDIIDGGGGSDTLAGGGGNDFYVVDGGDTIVETAAGGRDMVVSSASFTLGANLEALVLTGSALSATGNAAGNVLTGNAAANVLSGLAGNDVLTGGRGADRLAGGADNDRFLFSAVLDSTTAAADRIVDFAPGDKIDVHLIDAHAGLAGNQAFVLDALGAGGFGTGHIRQTKVGANLVLDFNTDADAASEMRIVLLNQGALKASDFIL